MWRWAGAQRREEKFTFNKLNFHGILALKLKTETGRDAAVNFEAI